MLKNLILENKQLKWPNSKKKLPRTKYSRSSRNNNKDEEGMQNNFKTSEDNFIKKNLKHLPVENSRIKLIKDNNKSTKCKWLRGRLNNESKGKEMSK